VPHPLEHRVAQTPLELEYGTLFSAPARLPVAGDPLWEIPTHARALIQTAEPEWGGHTRLERSLQGLPVRELREDGKMRHWTFDENANVRRQVDFDGHAHSFEYISDNHLSVEKDALGRVTRYEYSPTEQLTAVTDNGGTRSDYILDHKDRVSEVYRHGKLRERYSYDFADNVVAKHGGLGQLLFEETIGAGNRKIARKLGSGEIQTFAYDDRGRLIESRGSAGSCTFCYDLYTGTRTADLRNGVGVEHARELTGARTTTVLGRFTTRCLHQGAAQTTLVDPTGRTHALRHLGRGIYQRRFSSGAQEISQFDVQGRCLAKALYRSLSDDQPWTRAFLYSGEGDLIERKESARGTTRFSYDAAHRLQTIFFPNKRVDAYEYDAGNNLIGLPAVDLALRAAGERDRFDVSSGNRLRAAHGEHFQYDDRDHICRRTRGDHAVQYRRDSLDQLIEIQAPRFKFQAEYDPLGRRTSKSINGSTTTYYWDTDRLAAELFANGTFRIYVYASELALVPLLFIDYASLEAAPESGSVFFLFTDHLGAVERVLSHSGEDAWRAQLDPYGVAHLETKAPFHQPIRLPGHYYDAETGLHYNRFRYYDPKLGRYLETDPLGIEGGINLYAYTQNPLKEVDPRGLAGKCPNSVDCPKNRKKSSEDNDAVEGTNVAASSAKSDATKSVEVTDHHHAKLKQLAPGVTAHDVALAEHRNLSNTAAADQIAARKKVADAFYKKNGQEYALVDELGNRYGTDPKTGRAIKVFRKQTDDEREKQLGAIDYNGPIVVGPPPPCKTEMKQYQADGGDRGSYFADDGVPPAQLGIGDDGRAWNIDGQPDKAKVKNSHTINSETPFMESTAGPADDIWSVPGRSQYAPGGGRQTYIPEGCNPNSSMVQ
jgi:RHS repeat-associated protein